MLFGVNPASGMPITVSNIFLDIRTHSFADISLSAKASIYLNNFCSALFSVFGTLIFGNSLRSHRVVSQYGISIFLILKCDIIQSVFLREDGL